MYMRDSDTSKLTGTAIMAALVIIFDYSLKYSGLKIPFPWYPNLKFDFTGVPIILSLILYGFPSSITTSLVAGAGIIIRSGNVVSASMKVAAELSTVSGVFFGDSLRRRVRIERLNASYFTLSTGVVFRVVVMSLVSLYVLPNIYGVPRDTVNGLLPLIGVFNVIQGIITIKLGYFLNEAVRSRISNLGL